LASLSHPSEGSSANAKDAEIEKNNEKIINIFNINNIFLRN
jgi:hypothetical protein